MLISSLWKKTNCSASATPPPNCKQAKGSKTGPQEPAELTLKHTVCVIEANFRIKRNADKQQLMLLPAWILMKTHECVSLLTFV